MYNFIEFCSLLHKSPSEMLRKLVEAPGKAAIRRTQMHGCINVFVTAVRLAMTNSAAGDRELREMAKTSSTCAMLCEVTDERVFRRYQRKSSITSGMQ
jgi:hypothetical protein